MRAQWNEGMEHLQQISRLKEFGGKKVEGMKDSAGEWAKDIRSRYPKPEFERAREVDNTEFVKGTESSPSEGAPREEKRSFLNLPQKAGLRVDDAKM